MARTPPRLKATLGPRPMARLSLSRRAVEALPEAVVSRSLDALKLGRLIDASHRSDADFFIEDEERSDGIVRPTVLVLREVLQTARHMLPDLVPMFESFDPADVSAALDRIITTLVVDGNDSTAVLRALHLGDVLRSTLRQDPGLTELDAAKILTHGALEAYYYRRATREAKEVLDAYRDLIQLATGHRLDFINQDDRTETGMRVWEAWQALRGLNLLFGLSDLALEMKRQKVAPLPGLLFGGDVILYAGFARSDADALEESIAQLELIALRAERHQDLERAEDARTLLGAKVVAPPDTIPDDLSTVDHSGCLDRGVHERFMSNRPVAPRRRTIVAMTEDFVSVIERYEILTNGDDATLVVQLAPALHDSLRELYAELAAHHPTVLDHLYDDRESPSREVVALRMLLHHAKELDDRHAQIADAVKRGVDIGYEKD